jgi:septal ring factor EnvC (AmiA/AmiB activator)
MMKYLLPFVLVITASAAVADNLAKDKKTLENLQMELEQKQEALDKQKKAVKALEKKLECNYNLLQAYNQCEEKHEKNSEEYPKCMEKAKTSNAGCMDNA